MNIKPDPAKEALAPRRKRNRLNLSNTDVTDNGLVHLTRMESLVAVLLNGTKVTPRGVKKLKEAKPNMQVIYSHADE